MGSGPEYSYIPRCVDFLLVNRMGEYIYVKHINVQVEFLAGSFRYCNSSRVSRLVQVQGAQPARGRPFCFDRCILDSCFACVWNLLPHSCAANPSTPSHLCGSTSCGHPWSSRVLCAPPSDVRGPRSQSKTNSPTRNFNSRPRGIPSLIATLYSEIAPPNNWNLFGTC